MSAQILDGRKLAQSIRKSLSREVGDLKKQTGLVPRLVNVMIGDDPGSCAYANSQKRVAQQIGIEYELVNLPPDVPMDEFIRYIRQLNEDATVNGIMIHKPVPEHIDYRRAANNLDVAKDLEGINVTNVGKMLLGESKMIPCTPAAVMEHLQSSGVDLRGRETVIVGASEIVGKPLALLLLRQMATVTVCHIATSEAGHLQDHIRRAEVLIVAVGKAGLIKGEWIREGAVVIDVGINKVDDGIVGDVEFEPARRRAAYITPVPGGVGPVTVLMLMRNGLEAFKLQHKTVQTAP